MDAVSAKANPPNVGNVALIASIEPCIGLHHSCCADISIYKGVYSGGRRVEKGKDGMDI